MLNKYYEQIEAVGLNLDIIGFFLLKKNNVPTIGKVVVYFVLFLGAAGFVFKGIMQYVIEH
jgi:hypothetical protein